MIPIGRGQRELIIGDDHRHGKLTLGMCSTCTLGCSSEG
jgi:F0F1-type ATP synthase alpha subunit